MKLFRTVNFCLGWIKSFGPALKRYLLENCFWHVRGLTWDPASSHPFVRLPFFTSLVQKLLVFVGAKKLIVEDAACNHYCVHLFRVEVDPCCGKSAIENLLLMSEVLARVWSHEVSFQWESCIFQHNKWDLTQLCSITQTCIYRNWDTHPHHWFDQSLPLEIPESIVTINQGQKHSGKDLLVVEVLTSGVLWCLDDNVFFIQCEWEASGKFTFYQ